MLKQTLKKAHNEFFKKLNINKNTGIIKNKIKFATYTYIGSKYGKTRKILIIGLDIGSDEKISGIQSFEERRKSIEEKDVSKHNPHIAGTYFTALYFLKENLKLDMYWKSLKNIKSCQKALQNKKILPKNNPLSYIALTNYHKFVSSNRKNRSGGENRKYIDKEKEIYFFVKEIKILNPDIIIFQSNCFKNKKQLLDKLKLLNKEVYIGPHPAYRGNRKPEYFINQILRI